MLNLCGIRSGYPNVMAEVLLHVKFACKLHDVGCEILLDVESGSCLFFFSVVTTHHSDQRCARIDLVVWAP